MAHINGAIVCAMVEAGGRGGTTVSPELLQRFRDALAGLENETCGVFVPNEVKPFLTVLPGGRAE